MLFQFTSKMATFPGSQLLLLVLFSWNVHCFPAKKDWGQQDPYESSYSNVRYGSSHGGPASPSHPAVEGTYSSAGGYSAGASFAPGVSREASWNAAPDWDPVGTSTTTYSVSGTSGSGLPPPPPPLFQAGELNYYGANIEHGNSDRETEEETSTMPPTPPHVGFQAGELNQYTAFLEHGNEERESEEQGVMPPPYPSGSQEAASMLGPEHPAPQPLMPVGPSQHYLFMTGQLPPGTYTRAHSDYEAGRDHWDEVHYERYHYPAIPQIRQDYTKI